MAYNPLTEPVEISPTKTEGVLGVDTFVPVEDDDALLILKQILVEMKIMNKQLTMITHEEISACELRSL